MMRRQVPLAAKPVQFANIRDLRVSSDADIQIVSLIVVRAVAEAAVEHGVDMGGDELELDRLPQLADPCVGIPRKAYYDLLERIARRTGEPHCALALGRLLTEAHFHFVGPLLMNCIDARSAIDLFMTARRTVLGGPGWHLQVRLGHSLGNGSLGARIESELWLSAAMGAALRFWGRGVRSALSLELAYPAPADLQPYHAHFGPRVSFGARYSSVVMPASLLDYARPHLDPELASVLVAYARERFLRIQRPESWAELVRRCLGSVGSLAEMDEHSVAATWSISFSTIREHVRQERAAEMLKSGPGRVEDIAAALGYTEVNSFRRAFKRWSGRTPSSFRLDA